MSRRSGFTLIEILIFVVIFSLVIEGIVAILIAATRVQSNQTSVVDVETQGTFLLEKIQSYVQSARLIDMSRDQAQTQLTLREADASIDPTIIYASGTAAYVEQGAGSPTALTTPSVLMSGMTFTRHYNIGTSTAYGSDSVSYSFTLTENTSNTAKAYTARFQSAAVVAVPVGKIAMLQQASGGGSSLSSVSFSRANEAGSLLVAVASTLGNSTATISLSDTEGNNWQMVANPTYPAYGEQVAVFDATNAKAGNDTVNISYSQTAGGSTNWLSIYEYRGAATSSSFDAYATALQADTTAPVSGLAYPSTASDELVIGVLYSSPLFPPTPSAGSGFTVETTSSYSATCVEDENVFATGGVSAGWSLSSVASSSATVVMFK